MDTTRRAFLGTTGSIALGVTAGCLGSSPEGDAPESLPQPTLGDTESDIPTFELFEDYGCPHCLTFEQEYMPQLLEDYVNPGEFFIKYYDFPLPVRTMSKNAAVSGRVVQEYGGNEAFWEYKDTVMQNQENLSFELFRSTANDLGLDGEEVVKQTKSGAWNTFVNQNKSYGQELGISGTPGLVLDGTQIELGSYSHVASQIESILQN